MEKGKYEKVTEDILKYGYKRFSKRMTEEFIRYLHARLKGKKPHLTLEQLIKIR
jgi:hypothetical protein